MVWKHRNGKSHQINEISPSYTCSPGLEESPGSFFTCLLPTTSDPEDLKYQRPNSTKESRRENCFPGTYGRRAFKKWKCTGDQRKWIIPCATKADLKRPFTDSCQHEHFPSHHRSGNRLPLINASKCKHRIFSMDVAHMHLASLKSSWDISESLRCDTYVLCCTVHLK